MQKAFYTSVSNANLVEGKSGATYKSAPIPLIKENFLSEFRSNLEKLKVRKNLGIPDSVNLRWENIEGNLDDAPSLKSYIDNAWNLTAVQEVFPEIQSVADAMAILMEWVKTAQSEESKIEPLRNQLSELDGQLKTAIGDIDNLEKWQAEVNKTISTINETLADINNIIKLSETEGNALANDDGLYVKDLTPDIKALLDKVETYDTQLETTLASPYTVGGISKGTTVSELKDMPVTELLDLMLFPTVTRALVYPTYTASVTSKVVKIGDTPTELTFTFTLNDAGEKISEALSPELPETYTGPSTTTYTSTVEYAAGEYLVDSKGNTTNSRVEAGSKSASTTITTTYPWYINDTEQNLVPYNTRTTVEFSLIGNPVIKLPGINSTVTSFRVDGGLGYMNVDLSGWDLGTELINGITYLTWTKLDTYSSYLPHELTFTLKS